MSHCYAHRARRAPRAREGAERGAGVPTPRHSSGRPEPESKGASEREGGGGGANPPGQDKLRAISVAVPVPGLGALTYTVPDEMPMPPAGARVLVPLGNRTVTGIVLAETRGATREARKPVICPGRNRRA